MLSSARNGRLTRVTVAGYKSLRDQVDVELRPLTLLAGANSSGKSSLIQPVLLLKQTLESGSDPGPLLLNGDNVRFSRVDQMLSQGPRSKKTSLLRFELELGSDQLSLTLEARPERPSSPPLRIKQQIMNGQTLQPSMSQEELQSLFPWSSLDHYRDYFSVEDFVLEVIRERCFLHVHAGEPGARFMARVSNPVERFSEALARVIHVPGLRAAPERNDPLLAVRDRFPGRFEPYAASIVLQWMSEDTPHAETLNRWVSQLGLTGQVDAQRLDDTRVELRVGRTLQASHAKSGDMVSIADVGFGVSQVLPALVALIVASPGQLVYLEQPEVHLHPRAQHHLAAILTETANRGVQVVVETHSSILLTGIQTLVAEQAIDPRMVKLHWFSRNAKGWTQVSTGELSSKGTFGAWPVDFDEVELQAQTRYLDAVERSET